MKLQRVALIGRENNYSYAVGDEMIVHIGKAKKESKTIIKVIELIEECGLPFIEITSEKDDKYFRSLFPHQSIFSLLKLVED